MTTRAARTLRGTVSAVVAVVVAALSHVAAGAPVPHPLAVALVLAFAVPSCVALAGRELSLARLTVAVGVSQLGLHAAFAMGGSSTGLGMPATTHHALPTLMALTPAAAPHAHQSMWVAHAVAALLTIACLHRGEATLRALAGSATLLVARLRIVVVPALPSPAPAVAVIPVRHAPVDPRLALSALRHRGPPLVHA